MMSYYQSGLGTKQIVFVLMLVFVLPFVLVFCALYLSSGMVSFKMPALIACLTLPVALFLLYQINSAKIEIDQNRLIVGGGVYKEEIPLNEVKLAETVKLDSGALGQTIGFRTNGIGMPGFRLGWFSGKQGKRLFALITSGDVLKIPTTRSYDLVVSVPSANAFLSQMAAPAANQPKE